CIIFDYLGADLSESATATPVEKVADSPIQIVFEEILNELREKYPLTIFYVRGDEDEKKLKEISVGFSAEEPLFLNQDKCRELIVNCTEIMLKKINQNKDFKEHFTNMPFNFKHLSLAVVLIDLSSDIQFKQPSIWLIVMDKGLITYTEKDPTNPFDISLLEHSQEQFLDDFNITEE